MELVEKAKLGVREAKLLLLIMERGTMTLPEIKEMIPARREVPRARLIVLVQKGYIKRSEPKWELPRYSPTAKAYKAFPLTTTLAQ